MCLNGDSSDWNGTAINPPPHYRRVYIDIIHYLISHILWQRNTFNLYTSRDFTWSFRNQMDVWFIIICKIYKYIVSVCFEITLDWNRTRCFKIIWELPTWIARNNWFKILHIIQNIVQSVRPMNNYIGQVMLMCAHVRLRPFSNTLFATETFRREFYPPVAGSFTPDTGTRR